MIWVLVHTRDENSLGNIWEEPGTKLRKWVKEFLFLFFNKKYFYKFHLSIIISLPFKNLIDKELMCFW